MQNDDIKSLLENHHNDCYGWALHCCNGDREKAKDVLQAAYLKALEKYSTFTSSSAFKTWIFKIIKTTAIDALRKTNRERRWFRTSSELPDDIRNEGTENRLENKMSAAFLTEAIERLSFRQKQIIRLVFYHDMSLNQAAGVLQISQGSVRKQYDRAKKSLAAWFAQNEIMTNNIYDGQN